MAVSRAAFVTGGGGDLGRATCLRLAAAGYAVTVADIDTAAAEAVADEVGAAGDTAYALRVDVADEGDVERMVAETVARHGRLDLAVNNAGIAPRHVDMADLDLADWHANLDVNLVGVFLGMKHTVRHMLDHGGGAIVNIASVGAIKNVAHSHVYSAAKRAVLALTACAAREYGSSAIRVNAIAPGYIAGKLARATEATDPQMTAPYKAAIPSGAFGDPADIAAAVTWLASTEARYVNGHTLVVDGGMTA